MKCKLKMCDFCGEQEGTIRIHHDSYPKDKRKKRYREYQEDDICPACYEQWNRKLMEKEE